MTPAIHFGLVARPRTPRAIPSLDGRVGVENVVLAIVLRLEDHLGALQPGNECFARDAALIVHAIGKAAPAEEHLGEVAAGPPRALVDRRLESGAVGAWPGPENAIAVTA